MVHPALLDELFHRRIDNRISRCPFFPRVEEELILCPQKVILHLEGAVGHFRLVIEEVLGKVATAEVFNIGAHLGGDPSYRALFNEAIAFVENLVGADFTEVKVGGEP